VVRATLVAGLLMVATGCSAVTSNQTPSPPEASASAPTASPPDSSPPVSSPTAVASPSSVPSPVAKLIITSLPFHAAEVGIAYAPIVLGAKGGKPPYKWSASSGSLPTGLALSSDGKVSGTPAIAGAFSFVVRVDDSGGSAAGAARSITVAGHLKVSGSCAAQTCSVEQGCTTVCGKYGSQSAGVAPFKYAVTTGQLPPATSLNGLSLAGTFTVASKFFFAVTVTDALGAIGTVSANFTVFAHISLRGGTFAGKPGIAFVVALPYSGGTPGGTPIAALLKGTLPPGSTFAVNPKLFQVDITVPAQRISASYTTVFGLTDQSPCSSSSNCKTSATVVINVG
jgi:hypothetical protein